eukprot:CAMPEP_0174960892 /NCGR_PEP_ID=MMETSP0004_2-20121128/3942_1 /TAXON_ID=420556 /ORGANISM="Ochromonas sp., Strain CCMP1393" /LENGTH=256 /DNA_ID=CAMNT_0016209287 /DNA_START=103 /DNA_END=873 /DNA_ORIENTATION=-
MKIAAKAVSEQNNAFCPECRSILQVHVSRDGGVSMTATQLDNGNPILRRMYGKIQVKCEYADQGCPWRGNISDVKTHFERCTYCPGNVVDILQLKKELERTKAKMTDMEKGHKKVKVELEKKCESLSSELEKVGGECKRLKVKLTQEKGVRTNYTRRSSDDVNEFHNIPILIRLVGRYYKTPQGNQLSDHGIDFCQVYRDIKGHFQNWKRNYSDAPPDYERDVRILLELAFGSYIFNDQHNNNLRNMMYEMDTSSY